MPSVLPTGGCFAHARRRTKTPPDPWSMGALGGAILGDVAATPKMAGLAYEDGNRICKPFCTLKGPAFARGGRGPNSSARDDKTMPILGLNTARSVFLSFFYFKETFCKPYMYVIHENAKFVLRLCIND